MRSNRNVSDLKDHLGYWMRLVSNNVSFTFAKRLEAKGVTVAEWVILREMFESADVTSPSIVADLTGLTRGAISKLITRLLEKELVTRAEAAGDRRYQDIKLTSKGRNLVPPLARLADENDEAFFASLTRSERDQLKKILMKIVSENKMNTVPIE